MKIIVAPNAFKGSLSAREAAHVMAGAIKEILASADVEEIPFSDGGDGLLEVLSDLFGGEIVEVEVRDPLWRRISSEICVVEEMGLCAIEMAKASGLALLKDSERDPTKTTTYGTGELIRYALDRGAEKLVIGIGGSATNDGGMGMAAALGVRFLDKEGKELEPIGGNLIHIKDIDISGLDPRIERIEVEVVCDVDNPLLGENGAARVYGPQKGASEEQVEELERGLENYAKVVKEKLGKEVTSLPGAGAAGGLGAGLYVFLGATLRKGIEVMKGLVGLDEKIKGADLVLTGEGKLDSQLFFGKGPFGVAECALENNVPCIAIVGSIEEGLDELGKIGIVASFSICPGPVSLSQAMENSREYLRRATREVIRFFLRIRREN